MTTAGRCPSTSAITRIPTWSSPGGAPMPCVGSCSPLRYCGDRTWSSTPGVRRRGAPGAQPDLEHLVLPFALRQRRRDAEASTAPTQTGVLDRYMLAKTAALVSDVTAYMDAYDLFGACSAIVSYLDALTNWYVRRSRDRFWRGARRLGRDGERQAATRTTLSHTALSTLCRVAAPLLPLLTESVYQGLTGERSVHLADWPVAGRASCRFPLVAEMELVREVCSAGHAIRKDERKRLRLPLQTLTGRRTTGPRARVTTWTSSRTRSTSKRSYSPRTSRASPTRFSPSFRAAIGPRLGEQTQKVIVAVKRGDWTRTRRRHRRGSGSCSSKKASTRCPPPADPDA